MQYRVGNWPLRMARNSSKSVSEAGRNLEDWMQGVVVERRELRDFARESGQIVGRDHHVAALTVLTGTLLSVRSL